MGFNLAFNPLNANLNPICHLLALLGTHLIFHVSRLRVNGICRFCRQIQVAARSNTWVYGRLLAEIAGSNPSEGMDVCLLWMLCCCQVEISATGLSFIQRRPTVVCLTMSDVEKSPIRSPSLLRPSSQAMKEIIPAFCLIGWFIHLFLDNSIMLFETRNRKTGMLSWSGGVAFIYMSLPYLPTDKST